MYSWAGAKNVSSSAADKKPKRKVKILKSLPEGFYKWIVLKALTIEDFCFFLFRLTTRHLPQLQAARRRKNRQPAPHIHTYLNGGGALWLKRRVEYHTSANTHARACAHMHTHIHMHMHKHELVYWYNPTWGVIFECCFEAQSSKLESLFSLKRGKRDVRALSFELSKMSLHVELAAQILFLKEKLMHVRKKTVVVVVVVSLLIQ